MSEVKNVKEKSELVLDNELVEDKRKELKLKKPTEFENGRITPEDVENLMVLAQLPFCEEAVQEGKAKGRGFKSRGVSYALQLNRLQRIFGNTHVRIFHNVVESAEVLNDKKFDFDYDNGIVVENETVNEQGSEVSKKKISIMYYYKTYVTLQIGNYTIYTDTSHKPDSNFVVYYEVTGIGWAGANNKGTAEKNSVADGMKSCFKTMGMLRELYLEDDDESNKPQVSNLYTTKIELLEKPTIYENGSMFFKCRVKDITTGNPVTAIIYKSSRQNAKSHEELVNNIKNNADKIVKGKTFTVQYKENNYQGQIQYNIFNLTSKTT